MARTLLILGTHFVDETVISEYRKMKNTPNVDAILAIDNTNFKAEFKSRIENRIFYDTSVKCFFFDSELHDEMKLPYFTFDGIKDFGGVMWHNGDYRFYYYRKYFPDYDYYWQCDYDVVCNASTYEGFLNRFENNRCDLIIQDFRPEVKRGSWCWTYGLEWIYEDTPIYGSFYPVVRLSARAIDYLYQRRLDHKSIFEQSADKTKRWIFCELFTPTELMNGGFTCENLNEKHVGLDLFYLNDDRFFNTPDNHLYHPVKSVRAELAKHKSNYNNLFALYRKLFFNALIEKSAAVIKDFPIYYDKDFNYIALTIPKMGGGSKPRFTLRCTFCSR